MKILSCTIPEKTNDFNLIVVYTCSLNSNVRIVNKITNQDINGKSLIGIERFNFKENDIIEFKFEGKTEEKDMEFIKEYLLAYYKNNIKFY